MVIEELQVKTTHNMDKINTQQRVYAPKRDSLDDVVEYCAPGEEVAIGEVGGTTSHDVKKQEDKKE